MTLPTTVHVQKHYGNSGAFRLVRKDWLDEIESGSHTRSIVGYYESVDGVMKRVESIVEAADDVRYVDVDWHLDESLQEELKERINSIDDIPKKKDSGLKSAEDLREKTGDTN